jgi:hypothetical protein
LKVTAETIDYDPAFLEQERLALGENAYKREYWGIPLGAQASPFTWDLYERATNRHEPLMRPGAAVVPEAEPAARAVPNPFRALRPFGG